MNEEERRKHYEQVLSDFKDKKSRYMDYWGTIYKECEKHRKFTLLGQQLTDQDRSAMGLTNPLEPNLLLTYANHEANKTLQTDYRGKVTPNGSGANEVQARARQDVLRGIQRQNNINQVFNKVRRDQVAGGVSYSIVRKDWAGKKGFGKTLKADFLEDYQNVFPDINVKTATFSDARDFLIKREIPKSEWKAETGREPDNWGSGQQKKELWYYWVREDVRDTELLLADGVRTMRESSLPKQGDKPDYTGVKMGEDGQPMGRPLEDYTWCTYNIADEEVLDEETWSGAYPPLVACTGRKVVSDGKTFYQPLTQFAEEAQRVYTIIENIMALRLSKSPFSKWKVALESINIKDMQTLRRAAMMGDNDILFKALSDDGKTAIPPPEEIEPHILDGILITLQQEQERKIQRIFGIFDANLGAKSNEQSGVAIRERAQGGELSNFDLQFTYMEYVEQVSRVMLDLIPKTFTAPQQIAFVDEDDKAVLQWINTTGGVQFSPDEEYSMTIEAMPISQTAREDEAVALMEMAKVIPLMSQNPQVAALIAKAQPGRYSGQIAEILGGQNPQLQEAQAAIQELQGKLQAAEAKGQQDAINMAGLKGAVSAMKQQMTMMKQMQAMEGLTEDMRRSLEDSVQQTEAQVQAAELAIKQQDADSKRMGAEASMLTAEASMVSAVDKASRPDPKPKPVGGPAA